MPTYVLFSRLSSAAQRSVIDNPVTLTQVRQKLEEWEASIVADYHLLGEYDHCTVFEISDNFRAQRAVLQEEITTAEDSLLLTAIDLPLFERMIRQETRTEGPHEWQVKWWAKLVRVAFRWYQWDRWIWRYFKPLTVTGREHLKGIRGPAIFIANHTSHFDTMGLQAALPTRIRANLYMGAAADRWFLRKGGGRKELALQPWYNSLITGSFPIRRGGGSATLDYSRWLLDQGAYLGIFPEGTRSTSRKMSRFKHGVSILALDKGVPVIPIYLSGFNKIRPKGSREISSGPVWAHIQPPLYLSNMEVPDATRVIYESLNAPHERTLRLVGDAGRYDFAD
ncbi:MAG: 1-acyl-sn-glycerol-3-phosphate acyltransferase [Proteobacteria bacterium]|nr:1-acyl-sn-glycerol-3-phosphate acyltransferase [Pseudomonadota bacterium]